MKSSLTFIIIVLQFWQKKEKKSSDLMQIVVTAQSVLNILISKYIKAP